MSELYYIHDPMCSWCWGFAPVLDELTQSIPDGLSMKRLLGGLAPDSSVPMPEMMRAHLQQTWRRIQQHIPGTEFNFEFWTQCTPRRSTWMSCRAVIAAREQGEEYDVLMTRAIQRAYYLEARNPSDRDTLVLLADELGLDTARFDESLRSASVEHQFIQELNLTRSLGVNSYPSLLLLTGDKPHAIPVDYRDCIPMLEQISALHS